MNEKSFDIFKNETIHIYYHLGQYACTYMADHLCGHFAKDWESVEKFIEDRKLLG